MTQKISQAALTIPNSPAPVGIAAAGEAAGVRAISTGSTAWFTPQS